jgi:hypothetical protein
MEAFPEVQHSNLTRESSQKSSALWRPCLEYYFWQDFFFVVFVARRWLLYWNPFIVVRNERTRRSKIKQVRACFR